MVETKIFGFSKAKVLVIGHDPRLQNNDTIAEFAFFANYFFEPIPEKRNELKKYKFAEKVFSYIGQLVSYKYTADELIITNLCNKSLPHSPKGKTVLIPEKYAKEGLKNIDDILDSASIEIIFAMSQQVNYLLQKLGFYSSTKEYLTKSRPKEKGLSNRYYEPVGKSPFLKICGKKYSVRNIPIFPILHVKHYPLNGPIKKNYEKTLINCINTIKKLKSGS